VRSDNAKPDCSLPDDMIAALAPMARSLPLREHLSLPPRRLVPAACARCGSRRWRGLSRILRVARELSASPSGRPRYRIACRLPRLPVLLLLLWSPGDDRSSGHRTAAAATPATTPVSAIRPLGRVAAGDPNCASDPVAGADRYRRDRSSTRGRARVVYATDELPTLSRPVPDYPSRSRRCVLFMEGGLRHRC